MEGVFYRFQTVGVMELVSDFGGMQLCPPITRRPPGRPKKQRFFSKGEKLVRTTYLGTCILM